MSAKAYDYSTVTGADATGAAISGYESCIAIDVSDFGADSSGQEDSSKAIQQAFDYAAEHGSDSVQVKVIVPEGTYSICNCLWIHSNTWLYMEGATLRKDFSGGCMIMNYRDDLGKGFNGSHNIVLEGGCLDGNTYGGSVKAFSAVRMGHLHDLWVKNVEFKDNYNCHMLELGGIRNVTIEGCTFHEYYGSKYKEAIQFDVLNNANLFNGFAPFDDTPCENVVIKDNNFYDLMRGLGSHSATVGEYYTNFLITNNTFNNIYESAIIMENYRCCTIENNSMTNVGRGIDFRNMTSLEYSGYNAPVSGYDGVFDRINDFSDTIIKGNTINAGVTGSCEKPYGVSLYGKLVQNTSFPDHDYKVEGVLIEDNNITTAGAAIQMTDASGVLIGSNIMGTPADGEKYENSLVNVKYSADVAVRNNDMMNSNLHGIAVTGGSGNIITGNSCVGSASCGIYADKNAELKINDNTIDSAASDGIRTAGDAVADLMGNTISGSANGVNVKGCTKINIKDNNISSCSKAGIIAAEDAKAYVDENTLVDNEGFDMTGNVYSLPVKELNADEVFGDHVQLSWMSKGSCDGYSVKRRQADTDAEFEEIAVVSTPSYIDEDLPNKTRFEYRVDTLLETDDGVTESSSSLLNVKTKAPMSDCTTDIEPVYRYSGKRIEPELKVCLDGCELKKDVDYNVKYYNTIGAGTASVVISGCGQYFGFKEIDYEISLTEGVVTSSAALTESRLKRSRNEDNEVVAVSAAKDISRFIDPSETSDNTDSAEKTEDIHTTDGLQVYTHGINVLGGLNVSWIS